MNNKICCQLSKQLCQRAENLHQQNLPDREFGKELMAEFKSTLLS